MESEVKKKLFENMIPVPHSDVNFRDTLPSSPALLGIAEKQSRMKPGQEAGARHVKPQNLTKRNCASLAACKSSWEPNPKD